MVAGCVIAEGLIAEATRARNDVEKGGRVDLDAKGRAMIANNVKLQIRSLDCLKVYLDLLGFSPSSRANLTIDDNTDLDDPEDERWRRLAELTRKSQQPRKLNGSGSIQ